MRPPSYREQKACANCRHVVNMGEYHDEPETTHCSLGIDPKPERPRAADKDRYWLNVEDLAVLEKWNAQLIARESALNAATVDLHCVCDQHEPAPKATP